MVSDKKSSLPTCGCCSSHFAPESPGAVSRRGFLLRASVLPASAAMLGNAAAAGPLPVSRPAPPRTSLKVQPVLTFRIASRQQATSWREWGGLMTEEDVTAEKVRIAKELDALSAGADFPIEMAPLVTARTPEEAAKVAALPSDATLIYAAGGGAETLEALASPQKWNVIFLRHRSGPVYLWYEIVHPRFLRKTVDEYGQNGMNTDDVVVDSSSELLWRLRSLCGLKNTLGKRVVAVGGAGGWGEGGQRAPEISRTLWKLDLQDFSYPELGERIKAARRDDVLVKKCAEDAGRYLGQKHVSLETDKTFVSNAFLLTEVLRGIMAEAGTDAITINNCMGTIMPLAETTACLPLSLLNDDGYMAFCESDFVVIPSGILLHEISGKPVFLNDPTYPHDGIVTLAHCTAPRKMDGASADPVRILTHFESDYGAAPKVEMRKGQVVTNIVPDFASRRWLGFSGEIVDAPFLPICRSQIDVKIHGDGDTLAREMRGFHWMTSYGNYLRETGYALRKAGVEWVNLSRSSPALT